MSNNCSRSPSCSENEMRLNRPGSPLPAGRTLAVGLAVLVVALAVGACEKEGPAEHAGKEIDRAVEKAGAQIEKAGAKLEDAARNGGK
jgi:hypothetical protein